MQNESLSLSLSLKYVILKSKMADVLEWPILHHREMSQFFDFQDGSRPPAWIFKIKIFNSLAL